MMSAKYCILLFSFFLSLVLTSISPSTCMQPYLDKDCLVCGADWEQGFLNGLRSSKVVCCRCFGWKVYSEIILEEE